LKSSPGLPATALAPIAWLGRWARAVNAARNWVGLRFRFSGLLGRWFPPEPAPVYFGSNLMFDWFIGQKRENGAMGKFQVTRVRPVAADQVEVTGHPLAPDGGVRTQETVVFRVRLRQLTPAELGAVRALEQRFAGQAQTREDLSANDLQVLAGLAEQAGRLERASGQALDARTGLAGYLAMTGVEVVRGPPDAVFAGFGLPGSVVLDQNLLAENRQPLLAPALLHELGESSRLPGVDHAFLRGLGKRARAERGRQLTPAETGFVGRVLGPQAQDQLSEWLSLEKRRRAIAAEAEQARWQAERAAETPPLPAVDPLAVKAPPVRAPREYLGPIREQMTARGRAHLVAWTDPENWPVTVRRLNNGVEMVVLRPEEPGGQEFQLYFFSGDNLIGYGNLFMLGGTSQVLMHVFEEERGVPGFSRSLFIQALQGLEDETNAGIRRLELPFDQISNPDAIAAGAVVFYMKLGFRPRNEELLPFYEACLRRLDAGERLSAGDIRRLADSDWFLPDFRQLVSGRAVQAPAAEEPPAEGTGGCA
jgi:hypothetical protein